MLISPSTRLARQLESDRPSTYPSLTFSGKLNQETYGTARFLPSHWASSPSNLNQANWFGIWSWISLSRMKRVLRNVYEARSTRCSRRRSTKRFTQNVSTKCSTKRSTHRAQVQHKSEPVEFRNSLIWIINQINFSKQFNKVAKLIWAKWSLIENFGTEATHCWQSHPLRILLACNRRNLRDSF